MSGETQNPKGSRVTEQEVMKGCHEWTIQCRGRFPYTSQQSLKKASLGEHDDRIGALLHLCEEKY